MQPHSHVVYLLKAVTSTFCCLCYRNSLKEGWYMYTVEGSIWSPNSNFNNLVSVAGTDVYSQKDATYISVQADGSSTNTMSLYAGFKGAGWVLPEYNQSRVGIQRYQTWLQAFEGPKSPLTVSNNCIVLSSTCQLFITIMLAASMRLEFSHSVPHDTPSLSGCQPCCGP